MGKFFSTMRTVRLMRLLRGIRLLKKFPGLNRLAKALVDSIQSVVWIALTLFVLIFVSAIFVTTVIGSETDGFDEDPKKMEEWFGSMTASMTTLSIFLTMDDWSTPARAVNQKYPWMELFWVWYIVMGAFLILSLLTGLMADKLSQAREKASDDADNIEEAINSQLKEVEDRFAGGPLCPGEFREIILEENMVAALEKCGLKLSAKDEQDWLFRSIDRDGDGKLTWGEFKDALTHISKYAKPDQALREVMWLEGCVIRLDRTLRAEENGQGPRTQADWEQRLDSVRARSSMLRERLAILDSNLQDLFLGLGYLA